MTDSTRSRSEASRRCSARILGIHAGVVDANNNIIVADNSDSDDGVRLRIRQRRGRRTPPAANDFRPYPRAGDLGVCNPPSNLSSTPRSQRPSTPISGGSSGSGMPPLLTPPISNPNYITFLLAQQRQAHVIEAAN